MKVIDSTKKHSRFKFYLNYYLKIFRLVQTSHYSTYGKANIEPEITNRMKAWVKRG